MYRDVKKTTNTQTNKKSHIHTNKHTHTTKPHRPVFTVGGPGFGTPLRVVVCGHVFAGCSLTVTGQAMTGIVLSKVKENKN